VWWLWGEWEGVRVVGRGGTHSADFASIPRHTAVSKVPCGVEYVAPHRLLISCQLRHELQPASIMAAQGFSVSLSGRYASHEHEYVMFLPPVYACMNAWVYECMGV
jgi:hypothetical protein